MAVQGATTARVFETYVQRLLAPTLKPGQVVMDKLGAHRPKKIEELIKQRGCELVYLPSYSPDLNPIEEAFAKIKHILRKIVARTKEALIEAMGRALAAVGVQDAWGYFAHCGYRTRRSNYERRCEKSMWIILPPGAVLVSDQRMLWRSRGQVTIFPSQSMLKLATSKPS
jgi:transposase